jgi:hypothetical protein
MLATNSSLVPLGAMGVVIGFLIWQRPKEFDRVKEILEQSDFDLVAYNQIEKKYGFRSTNDAKAYHARYAHKVNSFFGQGGLSFLPT